MNPSSARSTSKCVRASRGLSVAVDIRVRRRVAARRRVDRAGAGLEPAPDQRQVLALHLAAAQHAATGLHRLVPWPPASGRTCRGRAGARRRGLARPLARSSSTRVVPRGPGRVDDQPGGLSTTSTCSSSHTTAARGRSAAGRRPALLAHADPLAGRTSRCSSPPAPVHQHRAAPSIRPRPGPASPSSLGQPGVEARARGARRDDPVSRRRSWARSSASSSSTNRATPSTIATSAMLNAGHRGGSRKSTAAPIADPVGQVAERAADHESDRSHSSGRARVRGEVSRPAATAPPG